MVNEYMCHVYRYLLENLNGDRTPDESLAAHPKAFLGCSISGCKAISVAEKVKGCVYLSCNGKGLNPQVIITRVYVAM